MPELDEIKKEVMADVDSDIDAWESFYEKYKKDYQKIAEYKSRIQELEEELKNCDAGLKVKLEKEKGTLALITVLFIVMSSILLQIISASLNVWLYFVGGLLIGLGAFGLLYLWIR